jgi:hypothetical protein
MHISTLVDDVQKVVEGLRKKHGDFTLAMLYNKGSLTSSISWNLIVSATWTDAMGQAETTHLIAHTLHDELNPDNWPAISRVTVLKTSDAFVQEMTYLYPAASPGGVPVGRVTAGDVDEGSGFIFYSKRDSPHSKQPVSPAVDRA